MHKSSLLLETVQYLTIFNKSQKKRPDLNQDAPSLVMNRLFKNNIY